MQSQKQLGLLKAIIRKERVISEEKMKEVPSIGHLLDAVKDTAGEDDFEDGRVTKEKYQKIQLLDMFILIFVVAGTGFCFLSVIKINFWDETDSR